MTRIVLAALLLSACKGDKPKDEPAAAKAATPTETKPAEKPVEPAPAVGSDPGSAAGSAAAAGCDPEKLKEEGMDSINMGQHEAALAKMEASLACKEDPYVVQLAFMESCSSHNAEKAKLYFKKLTPPQQTKFAQICIRNKTDYQ